MTHLYKNITNIIVITLPTVLITTVILELFFRFFVPACETPGGYFYEDDKIYSHNGKKPSGLFTMGKCAGIKSRWHINNMHWNYPIDYSSPLDKKLIAVIGDSYIEAFQVDADKNYPYLLRNKIYPDFEVYAFGKSGYPLSQYLHVARYVKKHLNPDVFIINLVHNDFDESIYQLHPYRYYFLQVTYDSTDGSFSETNPRPNRSFPQYKIWKRIVFKSSLVRYIITNLNLSFLRKIDRPQQFEANIDSDKVKKQQRLIGNATDYLVKTLKEENADKRIIFVLDAPRKAIYDGVLNESNVLWMHTMMENLCNNNNVELIDLTEPMKQDFILNKRRFNMEIDGHWNEYGHKFIADILFDYLMKNKQ